MTEIPKIVTPALIIERYLEVRECKKVEKAAFTKREVELDNALDAMENYLLAEMNKRGETHIKTDKGTAFKAPQTRVQLVDRDKLITEYLGDGILDVLAAFLGPGYDLAIARALMDSLKLRLTIFTNSVSKETCVAFVEANKAPPPGVEITNSVVVNVRKA